MIKKLRIHVISYVLCLLFVIGIFATPRISHPRPMGCESAVGDVCTA